MLQFGASPHLIVSHVVNSAGVPKPWAQHWSCAPEQLCVGLNGSPRHETAFQHPPGFIFCLFLLSLLDGACMTGGEESASTSVEHLHQVSSVKD